MGNLFFFSLPKNTLLIKERKLLSSKLSPTIRKQRIFSCRWHILHQKHLNDISGKKSWGPHISGFHTNPMFFLSCLLAAQPQAVSPTARARTSPLHTTPVWRWELRQAGGRGTPLPSLAQQQGAWETAPGKRVECAGERLSATGCLAMAVTSRVVSVRLSLVQPCVGRWVYMTLGMSKTQYILAMFWK